MILCEPSFNFGLRYSAIIHFHDSLTKLKINFNCFKIKVTSIDLFCTIGILSKKIIKYMKIK